MLDKDHHLSDEELLLTADGELSVRREEQARKHLAACWDCRTRLGEIENTIADFVRVHNRALNPQLPPAAGSRALLRARLSELASESRPQLLSQFRQSATTRHNLAFICAALAIAVLGISLIQKYSLAPQFKPASGGLALVPLVPKANLTPGATLRVSKNEICTAPQNVQSGSIPLSVQQKVFQEYGLAQAEPKDYEVDYLITPELGGASDIRNLWPEPHSDTIWNSYVKDDLENRLHRMVCDGTLDLGTAQHDIATDWIAAYKKYFRTNTPISNSSSLTADPSYRPSS